MAKIGIYFTIFIENVTNISVALGIIAFFSIITYNSYKGYPITLDDLLLRMLAASAMPTGFLLLVCAFDPLLISEFDGLNIHIAAAGLALLYISYEALFSSNSQGPGQNP